MNDVKTHLSLVDNEGEAINVSLSDVISIQPRLFLSTVTTGGVSMAAGAWEGILLKYRSGEVKVPRRADNDREMLDFIMLKIKEGKEQEWGFFDK